MIFAIILTTTLIFFPKRKIRNKCTTMFSYRVTTFAQWRQRLQDFRKIVQRTSRGDVSVARAPNFSAQKRPRIHLCWVTTTRNWLDSRRSFADVTTRKRKNKMVNGRRGARREEGTEQESERRKGGYIGRNIYEESSSMHPHPKVTLGCLRVCRMYARTCAVACTCVYTRVHVCETRRGNAGWNAV